MIGTIDKPNINTDELILNRRSICHYSIQSTTEIKRAMSVNAQFITDRQ